MKNTTFTPARRGALLALSVLSLGTGALLLPALTPVAQAKTKKPVLELWPGQRVLLVLPVTVGPNWNGGPELAEAIKPLVRPIVQNALANTGKFSLTLPYRFDPILRRAVVENRISQDLITPFVNTPSLATAQPVFSQLKFEQVPMVTEIQIEEIHVGGNKNKPTAQLQMSAKLYEIGSDGPFRSVVITSDAVEGRTPEARIQNAAANAAQQIAAFFVKAPDTFELPASLLVETEDSTKAAGNGDGKMPSTNGASTTPPKPTAPSSQPNAMNAQPGMATIPVLPPSQPPLGLDATGEKALGR